MSNDFNPEIVDSLNHPLAGELRKLLSGSGDSLSDQIIIDDEENILQALAGKLTLTYVFTTDKNDLSQSLIKQLPSSVPLIEVAKRTCKKIFASTRHSKLFAVAKMPPPLKLETLLKMKKDIIVLDSLSITGNIGAIIRTANAFDIDSLVFLNTAYKDIFDRRVIRSSRGYIFRIPVIAARAEELLNFCKAHHINIIVTSSHAGHLIDEVAKYDNRLAIVFGSEKEGCSEELTSQASFQVKIPISSKVESLNVSVAASIFMYLRNAFYNTKL